MNTPAFVSILSLVTFLSSAIWAGPIVWVEAEQFAQIGGWVNDPQFVDVMGSPYLLAHGLGKPVADAVTEIDVPQAGSYRLWVRSKDWLPTHSPGKFQVFVGGKCSPVTLGTASNDRWQWVDGGVFDLAAGKTELRLHDLTGWWGRCDALVLAGDQSFKPGNHLDELRDQRLRYNTACRDLERREAELVIVGGGMAGSAAAVAAARHGLHVVLIQDRPVLGGNASDEIQVPVGYDSSNEPYDPSEGGIVEEFDPYRLPKDWFGGTALSKEIEVVVRAEKNISLYLNTRAIALEMKDKKDVAGVLTADVRTGKRMLFAAPRFIDCTGHAWIGFWAGATTRHGTEARSEFNEVFAPEKADTHTMGNTLHNAAWKTHDAAVPFECPQWAYHWSTREDFEPGEPKGVFNVTKRPTSFDDLSRGKGMLDCHHEAGLKHSWWPEFGGMNNTIQDAESIRDELFRISIGLWGYHKNCCPNCRAKNANRELVWINHIMGVRESRRIMGDYILTERDYTEQIQHPDTVGYGGWTIDIHHVQGFWSKGPASYHAKACKVSIPLRSLYSKDIDNLLMAGRNLSASHVGLSGVRVMGTTTVMGQAAGTAAAIASRHQITPRGVYQNHITELQQTLLKDGCYLIGVQNADPNDLALTAAVSASSAKPGADPSCVINGWSRAVRGVRNAWIPDSKQSMPQWVQLDFGRERVLDTVAVSFQTKLLRADDFQVEVWKDGQWQRVSELSGNKLRRCVVRFDPVKTSKMRLVLTKIQPDAGVCEIRAYHEGEWGQSALSH
jgi:hypothetical protein